MHLQIGDCQMTSPKSSIERRFWSKVDKSDGCWIWTAFLATCGYGRFFINGKTKNAHAVAFVLAGNTIPPGYFVLHKCDIKPCVNPDHLYAGTRADNTRDTIERGQYHKWVGEKSPVAKLSDIQVKELRSRYKNGEKRYGVLGMDFGISKSHVWNIVSGHARRDCL